DALAGLEELYYIHPSVLTASLGQVVNGIMRLFIDDDRDVRKTLLHFCEEVVPSLNKADLQPFMPLLVMYTCSAMSHIYEDIRNDAVKLMDLWVDTAPEIIATRYWDRVVGIYTSLLSVSSTSTTKASSGIAGASKIANADSAKAAAAKSHLHLHKSIKRLWFLSNFLESKHARDNFKRKMKSFKSFTPSKVVSLNPYKSTACHLSHPRVDCFLPYLSTGSKMTLNIFDSSGPSASNNESKDPSGTTDEVGTDAKASVKMLIETFQPVLLSTWVETASTVFGASSTIHYTPALQLLRAILHLTLVLWRTLVSSDELERVGDAWLEKHCHQLLKHFVIYFPYGSDALGDGGAKSDAALREMNIETCELTSLFLLAKLAGSERVSIVANSDWIERVVDYTLGVLGYEVRGKHLQYYTTSSNFKESDLTALLPAVWGFLNTLESKDQCIIFKVYVFSAVLGSTRYTCESEKISCT
ncbi:Rix1 complex component, partial [Dichotomocladium elegans]